MHVKSFSDVFHVFRKLLILVCLSEKPRGIARCETDLTESVGCIRLALAVA